MNSTALHKATPLLIVALVAALYGQFLWNPIVFDDVYFFLVDKNGQQPVSGYQFAWLQMRSLPYATLAWTKSLLGLDLIYFRMGNLLLHAAVCVALWGFLRALFTATQTLTQPTKTATPGVRAPSPNAMALTATLLFAVHPVATYAAGYLVQRTMLFATLFCLLALWAWVRGSVQRQPLMLWLTVPLYYLAVFSKEHVIMLLAVLPLVSVLLFADWRQRLQQQAGVLLALLCIAAVAVLARKNILGSVYEVDAGAMLQQTDGAMSYPLSVLTQMALFFQYAGLWLLPNPGWMSIDMREPFATLSPLYVLGALAFLAWGVVGGWLLFRRGRLALLGFALLFPWLMFLTELSTVRIQEVFVLYRSYVWAVGVLCALPLLLQRLSGKSVMGLTLLGVALLFPVSMERLATMSHPILLWEDAATLLAGRTELPGASRIYYNRGTEYLKAGLVTKAIPDFKQAASLAPDFSENYANLALAYYKLEDWGNAAQSYGQALDAERKAGRPPSARYFLARAQIYERTGQSAEAQSDYRESCRLRQLGCDKVH